MGIFDFLKGNKGNINWDELRLTKEVYPANSISIVMTQSESGKPATGWVDLGYKEYEYKKYCPFNLQFNIWIDDSTPEDLDMGTIEDYFSEILKKQCVVHPVARVATDFGMIMDLYIDNPEFAQTTLAELSESDKKLVEFGCGFNHDPKWKEYNRITKLTE
ncbi:MAG: hypothetical protein AAFY71_12265 [Bacteroidota bacterium]